MVRVSFTILALLTTLFWGSYASGWRMFSPATALGSSYQDSKVYLVNTRNFKLPREWRVRKQYFQSPIFCSALAPHKLGRSANLERRLAYDPEHNVFIFSSDKTRLLTYDSRLPSENDLHVFGCLMTPDLSVIKHFESGKNITTPKTQLQIAMVNIQVKDKLSGELSSKQVYASFFDRFVFSNDVIMYSKMQFFLCLTREELRQHEIISKYPEHVRPLVPNLSQPVDGLTRVPIQHEEIWQYINPETK